MEKQKVEVCKFQNKLQDLYHKMLVYAFYIILIVSVTLIIKFACFFFIFNIYQDQKIVYNQNIDSTAVKILNFFIMPELSSATNETLFKWQDVFQMLSGILTSILLIFVICIMEKKYIQTVVDLKEQPLIFLFTLQISNLKTRKNAEDFDKIINMLRPNGSLIISECYIYDMRSYQYQKERVALENKEEQQPGILTSAGDRIMPTEHEYLTNEDYKKLGEVLKDLQDSNFSNKLLLTLNDLIIIRDIIYVYHSGLLAEKIKRDIQKAMVDKSHTEDEIFLLKNSIDSKDGFLNDIKIQLAHDVNDIIWKNFSSTKKNYKNYFRYLGVFIATCIFSVGIFMFERLYIVEMINLKFLKTSKGFSINFQTTEIILNFSVILLSFLNLILPVIGSAFIGRILQNVKTPYISSYNNITFFYETTVEACFRFLATHYGYTSGMLAKKSEIPESQIPEFFYYINMKWTLISLFLLLGFVIKVVMYRLEQAWDNYKAKKSPRKPVLVHNTITSSNVILVFMYLGFYQSLLSTLSLIFITLDLLLNFMFDSYVKKDQTRHRSYISYYNIIMIIQFALFIFALGGLFAFNMQINYSNRYFTGDYDDNFFPYFLITSIVIILIYTPTFWLLSRHNSVSLRLLNHLIENDLYSQQQEAIADYLQFKSYKSENPYYEEYKLLNLKDSF